MENVSFNVSYIDTLVQPHEAKSKTFDSLEEATDYVYIVVEKYEKLKLTNLYRGNIEVFKSSIEIEKQTREVVFLKELMIKKGIL